MSRARSIKDRTAVVGIGQTAFGKGLPDTELSLACQAISLALDDAGIAPSEVDGLASFTMEPNREVDVARNVGLGDITFFSQVGFGGGAGLRRRRPGRDGGRDRSVRRSRSRGGPASAPTPTSRPWAQARGAALRHQQWSRPFGILRPGRRDRDADPPATCTSTAARAITSPTSRSRSASTRRATRTSTMGHKPLTRDDYMNARWISEPLCLFDNCLETDGALAVVHHVGRARHATSASRPRSSTRSRRASRRSTRR